MGADEIPRRARMEQWTDAERAIYDAMLKVEAMPADVRLTDAVTLLGSARDRVADFVDGIPSLTSPWRPIATAPRRPFHARNRRQSIVIDYAPTLGGWSWWVMLNDGTVIPSESAAEALWWVMAAKRRNPGITHQPDSMAKCAGRIRSPNGRRCGACGAAQV